MGAIKNIFIKPLSEKIVRRSFLLALFFSATINLPYYYIKIYYNPEMIIYVFLSFVFSLVFLTVFFVLFSKNRNLFIILFVLLYFLSGIILYFLLVYKIEFSPTIIALTLETSVDEILGIMSYKIILTGSLLLLISYLAALWFVTKKDEKFSRKSNALFIAFCIVVTSYLHYHNFTFFPVDIFHKMGDYLVSLYEINKPKLDISQNNFFPAYEKNRDLNIVLVIGESVRGDHLQINGYHRETTPLLLKKNVLTWPDITSPYTFTRYSVPFMITRATVENPGIMEKETSFISIFNKMGYKTYWISNQEIAGIHANLISSLTKVSKKRKYIDLVGWSHGTRKQLDEELIPYYEKALEEKAEQKLIVLHTTGSHWNYNAHYSDDFKKFTPVVKSNYTANNSIKELTNSYDNSILYMDFFLNRVIDMAASKNSIVIYISDHGESLGENGNYMHGKINVPEQKITALIIWFSDTYYRNNVAKCAMMKKNQKKKIFTDILFPTILDCADIRCRDKNIIDFSKSLAR